MRILSISAQKPDSTGSGTYLTELVRGWDKLGHDQAVICGVYRCDTIDLPPSIQSYPVYFNTPELPIRIAGMSDAMPYESMRYRDMDARALAQFKEAFSATIKAAIKEFRPTVIVCHHLYIVTALARSISDNIPVVGLCHGTCLRQFEQHPLEREFILSQIPRLDAVLALHHEQAQEITRLLKVNPSRITVVGCGYNPEIFNTQGRIKEPHKVPTFAYAGKITRKKGLYSLLEAVRLCKESKVSLRVVCAGGHNDKDEFADICKRAEEDNLPMEFLGALSQTELATVFKNADVFVLPSFFEGLPLVLVEAMACGCAAVTTDLPGVRPWIEKTLNQAPVSYVELPRLCDVDTPLPEDLPRFNHALAQALVAAIKRGAPAKTPDTTSLTWEGVCTHCLTLFENALRTERNR